MGFTLNELEVANQTTEQALPRIPPDLKSHQLPTRVVTLYEGLKAQPSLPAETILGKAVITTNPGSEKS